MRYLPSFDKTDVYNVLLRKREIFELNIDVQTLVSYTSLGFSPVELLLRVAVACPLAKVFKSRFTFKAGACVISMVHSKSLIY